MSAIGRNNRCPCGSGKKFKHCHLGNVAGIPRDMTINMRNQILLNAAEEIFGFRRGRTWADFKRTISGAEVKSFYEVQASIWPPETNWAAVMPTASSKLRALYLGDIDPVDIARNLVRYSLYSDELMLVDPFHNPWMLQPEYNPIDNPDQFKPDTLRLLFFLFSVSPWIRSGLLQMVPDPGHFYRGLQMETFRQAKIRWGDRRPSAEDMAEGRARGHEEMGRVIQAMPPNELFRLAEKATGKPLSEEQKVALLAHLRQKLRDDPLAIEQPLIAGPQLQVFRAGANLETALLILNQTGAFPYTGMKFRWDELMSVRDQLSPTARLWSPLTRAFQNLEFRFLDNVDVDFAEMIRQDGRLETFRALLRRVGKDAETIEDEGTINSYVRDVTGELSSEYLKAKADWNKIDERCMTWATTGIGASMVSGHLWPDISVVSVGALGVVSQLLLRYMRQQQFRKINPMSVFIDLAAVEPPGVRLI